MEGSPPGSPGRSIQIWGEETTSPPCLLFRWPGSPTITLAVINACRYYHEVIKSFADRDTERLFRRERVRRLGAEVQRVALRKLRMLDAATVLDDLRTPPANRLEKLKGDRSGQHSIRINRQWRICFVWRGGDAYDVEIVDYH